VARKGGTRVNMVQKMCKPLKWMQKWYLPVKTISRNGRWRGWMQVWYIWYIVRIFVNATNVPIHHNNKGKKKKNSFLLEIIESTILKCSTSLQVGDIMICTERC
jgi:hypothetical protein